MLPEITEKGASLITISPQLSAFARAWAEEDRIASDVLIDAGNQVARSYGLTFKLPDYLREVYEGAGLDLDRLNGDESWELPLPATFVIGTDGTFVFAQSDPDYTVRPEPADVVAAIPTT